MLSILTMNETLTKKINFGKRELWGLKDVGENGFVQTNQQTDKGKRGFK